MFPPYKSISTQGYKCNSDYFALKTRAFKTRD
jgi:hypothetical protein